jgi:hypothetical protein
LDVFAIADDLIMLGVGWQCQGWLPESSEYIWIMEVVILANFDWSDFVVVNHDLTCVKCRDESQVEVCILFC